MNFPENLKYTKDHEWIRLEGNEVVIGITEFAQSELGDIVYVEIETEGDTIDKEAVFGTVEAVKTVSDLFMPVTGKILAFNKDLESEPEAINKDPYGKGWLVKIEIQNPGELVGLLDDTAYRTLIGK